MNERKHIDRLFQEKFKDFEATPDPKVWENIAAALGEKKKKRRVVPFWWQLSGVAAALIIGLFVLKQAFSGDAQPSSANPIVNKTDGSPSLQKPATEGVANQETTPAQPARYASPKQPAAVNPGAGALKSTSVTVPASQNGVATAAPALAPKKSKTETLRNLNTPSSQEAVAENQSKASGKTRKERQNRATERLAYDNANQKTAGANRKTNRRNNGVATPAQLQTSLRNATQESAVADNGTASQKAAKHRKGKSGKTHGTDPDAVTAGQPDAESALAQNKTQKNAPGDATQKPDLNPEKVNVLNNNAVAANPSADRHPKTDNSPKTDPAVNPAPKNAEPNELEKLLAQKDEKENKVAESKVNRWQVSSSVAPIYFNSSGGSPLDQQFASNDKSYDNNLSYGVGVNYAINDKLSVRTGVNKLTLGYETNGVIFYAGLDGQSISNVSQQGNAAFIEVKNRSVMDGMLPFETNLPDLNYGSISQRMGFIEVPMELSYKLVDKQFGITLIGGMSTLFLNDNEVRVVSNTFKASLGEANNLNEVHFSSNIGMGFKYNFLKAFELHFEPMFKYQLSTFSKDSGNFKPYFIGLYSGVSYKF